MRASTLDDGVQDLVDAADRARLRRVEERGLSWTSVGRVLEWYFPMREKLQSPVGMHPRTSTSSSGAEVLIRVQGGKGGDIDEVLAVMASVAKTLGGLSTHLPAAAKAIELRHRDGASMEEIAKILQVGPTQASLLVGRGEAFVTGALMVAGVIR